MVNNLKIKAVYDRNKFEEEAPSSIKPQ
jgi:hypothetical protein